MPESFLLNLINQYNLITNFFHYLLWVIVDFNTLALRIFDAKISKKKFGNSLNCFLTFECRIRNEYLYEQKLLIASCILNFDLKRRSLVARPTVA